MMMIGCIVQDIVVHTLESDCQSSNPTSWLCNLQQVMEPLWALIFLYVSQR